MQRTIPIKFIITLCVVAVIITAAVSNNHMLDPQSPATDISEADRTWAAQHIHRPQPPLPRLGQAQVLLSWRNPIDAATVRPLLPLVDHPEGQDGVYAIDVASNDPLLNQLGLEPTINALPAPGAWLLVRNGGGRLLGQTPIVNATTIAKAFAVARGQTATFDDAPDPYLGQQAPDFISETSNGKPFVMSAQKGKRVVIAFYCGCSRCQAMGTALAPLAKKPQFAGVEWLTVTHMTPFAASQFFKTVGQTYTIINETPAGIANAYSSKTCPRIWYIGADGKVQYYSEMGDKPAAVVRALQDAVGEKPTRPS